jgi:hypothetical protein
LEASASPDHSAQEAARSPLRVAIIVPFRDSHPAQKRQAHLDKFVPHMTALLTKQDELRYHGGCAFFFIFSCFVSCLPNTNIHIHCYK